jgi:hypothetical protein
VDDFEHVETSPWEGVRNYEARNLMKEMKVGQAVCAPLRTHFPFSNASFLCFRHCFTIQIARTQVGLLSVIFTLINLKNMKELPPLHKYIIIMLQYLGQSRTHTKKSSQVAKEAYPDCELHCLVSPTFTTSGILL